jgi:general secretion pathway protein K
VKNGGPSGEWERGWALISVLWALSILAVLLAAAQALSFGDAKRERRALDDAQARAALEAGVVRAVAGIADPRPERRWRVDGMPQDFTLDGQTVRVTIQDEFGRIDLNAADSSLLNQLLRANGVEKNPADALTARIVAWRSPSAGADFTRANGDSTADYARAGRTYRPRHAAFQSVDELQMVLGMTPELLAKLRPALTVYSRNPAIDTANAPRSALAAYFPNQPERVNDMMRERARAARPGTLASGSGLAGRSFDIMVELPGNPRARAREAIVLLTNDIGHPYLLALWR